jgi:(p)ppGpp synthase/HD superfamily hydrolase
MKTISQVRKEHIQIQKAIKFLIDKCLDKKGNLKISNQKTVMHSLRTGFDLLKRGYDKDIVIGAILHDIEEDAGVSIKEIEKKFGKKVAKIVEAVSFNPKIKNQKERDLDLYKRIARAGREAMIVSVADHLDNADYYRYIKSKLNKEYVKQKWKMFLKIVVVKISKEPIAKEFKKKFEDIQ